MDVESLTYDELGQRLGITRKSARQLAMRKRWLRQPGNDGLCRVAVPLEALTRPNAGLKARPEGSPEARPEVRPEGSVEASPEAPSLHIVVARLEEQVAGLKHLVEEGNRRSDELRVDRDRWAAIADELARKPRGSWWPFRRSA